MNLYEIRHEFVKQSGRYDLVGSKGEDLGANFFIASGQRFLDRHSHAHTPFFKSVLEPLAKGEGFIYLPDCYFVTSIRICAASENVWHPLWELHSKQAIKPMMAHQGKPHWFIFREASYAPNVLDEEDTDKLYDIAEGMGSKAIIEILPKPSRDIVVEVTGRFFSTPLVHDQDVNFWSIRHPEVLIKASLYELEVFYRNTEGAKDWLESLQLDLTDIEQLEIYQECHKHGVMGL